jgi:hypothetical protein
MERVRERFDQLRAARRAAKRGDGS